jgi:hypothetical protein
MRAKLLATAHEEVKGIEGLSTQEADSLVQWFSARISNVPHTELHQLSEEELRTQIRNMLVFGLYVKD